MKSLNQLDISMTGIHIEMFQKWDNNRSDIGTEVPLLCCTSNDMESLGCI